MANIQIPPRLAFRLWPKGFKQDIFFKSYFSFAPKSLPIYYGYFYKQAHKHARLRFFCVRSNSYSYISGQSIEAFRKVLAPTFRKRSYYSPKFNILVYPFLALTKKPAEVRIGGGKGSKIRKFVSPVKPGQILFTITSYSPTKSLRLLRYASKKLGVSTSISFI